MPRKPRIAGKIYAIDPDRQEELETLEAELDKVTDALFATPTNSELNSRRMQLEIKIITITGETPLDSTIF